ncbi:hypothetical protein D9M72_420760 [compost metagenome]
MSERTASLRTVESTVTGSLDVMRPSIWGKRDAVLTFFSIPLEPTDGRCAGDYRPEQQD